MVQYCIVPQCKNRASTPGISFHKLPGKEELKRAWIMKIQRDESSSKISASMRICSAHFVPENYREVLSGRKFLKPDAIPSVFFVPPPRKGHRPLRKIACKNPNREEGPGLLPPEARDGRPVFMCKQVCRIQSPDPDIDVKMGSCTSTEPRVKSEPDDGTDSPPVAIGGFEFVSVGSIKQERIEEPVGAEVWNADPPQGSRERACNDGTLCPCSTFSVKQMACLAGTLCPYSTFSMKQMGLVSVVGHDLQCRSMHASLVEHDHAYAYPSKPPIEWGLVQSLDRRTYGKAKQPGKCACT